jgi:hypothetical protein
VYVTSLPVEPAIVEYYLRFLPDPEDARRRLSLVAVGEEGPLPLSRKLLKHPEVVDEVRAWAGDAATAHVLPFIVTPYEYALSEALGLPLYGPHPDLGWLGSKTGSRTVAREAGVAVFEGAEGLFSVDAVEEAIASIRARRPDAGAVVVKLNDGFSGQGNAIVELDRWPVALERSGTTFCAPEESWPSFTAKIAADGAIVEELVRVPGSTSPSVQLRIAPSGAVEVLSTHDQVLGGPDNQVYLGCRFPAHPGYRLAIQEAALAVAKVLSSRGVIGTFGIDFVVVPGASGPEVYLSEINLRMGGTTHTFWMARLATGGAYDPRSGELWAGDRQRCYVATDNLKSAHLVGRSPAEVIELVDRRGLGFDPSRREGATLHLLGAVRRFGKMGVTCVAGSVAEAEALHHGVLGALGVSR